MLSRLLQSGALILSAHLISGVALAKDIRVALFNDAGSTGKGVPRVTEILGKSTNIHVTQVKGEQIAAGSLTNFDVVIFTGGSGSQQAKSLGDSGREQVRNFVRNGGGYVGICAGAYLACNGFDWGVGVLNAKTISSKWQRGKGTVKAELLPTTDLFTNKTAKTFDVLYANGPIIQPNTSSNIPPYETIAAFRTELAKNDTPKGIMINAPAMARGTYGQGRVVISSPHPEQTDGLEDFVETFVRWTAQ